MTFLHCASMSDVYFDWVDLSVDLRDVVGDRLMLSGGLQRDGVKFDVGEATTLRFVTLHF